MGKCVCCGKDAEHSFVYYIGKQIKSIRVSYDTNEVTYKDIMQQEDYLCKKCIANPQLPLWGIVICTPLLIFTLVLKLGPICAILAFLIVYLIVRLGEDNESNKRYDNGNIDREQGAKLIIEEIKLKRSRENISNVGIAFFTPEQFQNLKTKY